MESKPHPIVERTCERDRKRKAVQKYVAEAIIVGIENYISNLDTYEIGRIQNERKTKKRGSD